MNESSSLLHGSVPNTDYRHMHQEQDRLLFFASERVRDLRIVLIARGRAVPPPGGGLSIPFPHARMNPTNIDVAPPAQSERERSSATYGGFT